MAAIPPNTHIDGFIKSMQDGVYGVFNKGVKYGRYLEQQERGKAEWLEWNEKFMEHITPSGVRLGVFCSSCECHADNKYNFCPECGKRMINAEVKS